MSATPGVELETEPCASALAENLRQLGAELPAEPGWSVSLKAGWRLTVRRPDSSVALHRELAANTQCSEVVKASALILERFFHALPLEKAKRADAGAPRDPPADGTSTASGETQRTGDDGANPSATPAGTTSGGQNARGSTNQTETRHTGEDGRNTSVSLAGANAPNTRPPIGTARDTSATRSGTSSIAQNATSAANQGETRRSGDNGAITSGASRRGTNSGTQNAPSSTNQGETRRTGDDGANTSGASSRGTNSGTQNAPSSANQGETRRNGEDGRNTSASLGTANGLSGQAETRRPGDDGGNTTANAPTSTPPVGAGTPSLGPNSGAQNTAQANAPTSSPPSADTSATRAGTSSRGPNSEAQNAPSSTAQAETRRTRDNGGSTTGNAPTSRPPSADTSATRVGTSSGPRASQVSANASPPPPSTEDPSRPSAVTAGTLVIAPMLSAGTSRGFGFGGSLLAHLEFLRVWRFGLRFGLALPSSQSVVIDAEVRGAVTGVPFWAAARGERCTSTFVRFCGGLDAGARFILATASGNRLYRTGQSLIAAPTLGAVVSLDVRLWHGFTLGLDVTGSVPVRPSTITIDGGPTLDFGNTLEILTALTLGWSWGDPNPQ